MGLTDQKHHCKHCGREMFPAPARWDGEPTFVGLIPCPCKHPLMTDYGVVYPGDEDHTTLMNSRRYNINDLLTPIK